MQLENSRLDFVDRAPERRPEHSEISAISVAYVVHVFVQHARKLGNVVEGQGYRTQIFVDLKATDEHRGGVRENKRRLRSYVDRFTTSRQCRRRILACGELAGKNKGSSSKVGKYSQELSARVQQYIEARRDREAR